MFQNYLAHKTAERISEYVLHGHTVKCMCTYPVTHYKAILRFQKVLLHTQKGGGQKKTHSSLHLEWVTWSLSIWKMPRVLRLFNSLLIRNVTPPCPTDPYWGGCVHEYDCVRAHVCAPHASSLQSWMLAALPGLIPCPWETNSNCLHRLTGRQGQGIKSLILRQKNETHRTM